MSINNLNVSIKLWVFYKSRRVFVDILEKLYEYFDVNYSDIAISMNNLEFYIRNLEN